ncbi:hypothetical protein [Actinopolyspora mortivallis]|uniref:hypothetical protein n=1 Tax=Actinopolyspora mortivallis TaxID=33906 RepID=UPI0011B205BC|nr:hypothetical protein [Actinopolyspora mortivallis]
MMSPRQERRSPRAAGRDPAGATIRAAVITRRGTVFAACITALVTLVTSSFTLYFTTRDDREDATTPAGVTETTEPSGARGEDAAPTTDGSPEGVLHLADRVPVEGEGYWERGEVTVAGQARPRALSMDASCYDGYTVGFNVAGRSTFRTGVGLPDHADSDQRVTFTVLLDGSSAARPVTVSVGETEELRVDVEDGFRVRVNADPTSDCVSSAVLIDPVLLP